MVRLMVGYLVVMTVDLTEVRKEIHLALMKAGYSARMKAESLADHLPTDKSLACWTESSKVIRLESLMVC
jgi:hypothetical protein